MMATFGRTIALLGAAASLLAATALAQQFQVIPGAGGSLDPCKWRVGRRDDRRRLVAYRRLKLIVDNFRLIL